MFGWRSAVVASDQLVSLKDKRRHRRRNDRKQQIVSGNRKKASRSKVKG